MITIPLIPWEPSVFPDVIQAELDRRKTNRSFNYVNPDRGMWTENSGDWSKYNGPMSPWVRFCSNGAGVPLTYTDPSPDTLSGFGTPPQKKSAYPKQGFVLFGGKDFYSSYGFLVPNTPINGSDKNSIIGYLPNGTPHVINNNALTSNYPIHVPAPEIERISVTIQKELYRRAMVEWVCFSPKQLEYMTPYFLVPGITCILEWGWNHFDPASLLNLDNVSVLKELNRNPYPLYTEHILKSRGNYDVLIGKVTHFEWSIDGNKIKCKTEITSQDRLYAGVVVDSTMIDTKNEKINSDIPNDVLDNLKKFIEIYLPDITTVLQTKKEDLPKMRGAIGKFISFLLKEYPEDKYGKKAINLIYGIFSGRDFSKKEGDNIKYASEEDFDKAGSKSTWINIGLLIEILNYHAHEFKNESGDPIFKIDLDDCVVGGHPNLISTDGDVILIPNSEAPKYSYGLYGEGANIEPTSTLKELNNAYGDPEYKTEYQKKMGTSDINRILASRDLKKIEELGLLPDWKLIKVFGSGAKTSYRDDLDREINRVRYEMCGKQQSFAFPFKFDQPSGIPDTKEYPRRYSGYVKDIYFNISALMNIMKDGSVKIFPDIVSKVLTSISTAAGNFWDFRLVSGTGKHGDVKGKSYSTMKIVDYRFISSINYGKVYTFDYFDADSLLRGLKFTPTLSNAQAIRTIYANVNNPNRNVVLSDSNELLDYQFKDRLFLDEIPKTNQITRQTSEAFKQTMTSLQGLKPATIGSRGSYQMTVKNSAGKIICKRLAMPDDTLINLILDDGDIENNPKYTGIMPNIQAQFTIQGIGGLRTFMMFLVRNLPRPYSHKDIVFRIIDLTESVEAGNWTTTITAGIIPLRKHVKQRLGLIGETN